MADKASKIEYFGKVLIDLTEDTIEPEKMVTGVTAHDKTGTPITGTNPYEKTATDTAVNNALAKILEKGVSIPDGAGVTDLAMLIEAIVTEVEDAVRYSVQSLTDIQKAQARSNIGAASSGDVESLLEQAKESGDFDGEPFEYSDFTAEQLEALRGATGDKGTNGTSITHSWSGTTLSVTSASGTSSKNLGLSYTYGASDLTAGTSTLAKGTLYFVYE